MFKNGIFIYILWTKPKQIQISQKSQNGLKIAFQANKVLKIRRILNSLKLLENSNCKNLFENCNR